jgi:hypothetical protein
MQFLRITSHTAPSGLSIFGRVGLPCAEAGDGAEAPSTAAMPAMTNHIAAAPNLDLIEKSPSVYFLINCIIAGKRLTALAGDN